MRVSPRLRDYALRSPCGQSSRSALDDALSNEAVGVGVLDSRLHDFGGLLVTHDRPRILALGLQLGAVLCQLLVLLLDVGVLCEGSSRAQSHARESAGAACSSSRREPRAATSAHLCAAYRSAAHDHTLLLLGNSGELWSTRARVHVATWCGRARRASPITSISGRQGARCCSVSLPPEETCV